MGWAVLPAADSHAGICFRLGHRPAGQPAASRRLTPPGVEHGPETEALGCGEAALCYIPSLRVLKEGGYEAVDSMYRCDQPGPLAEDVEERGFTAIRNVLKRVGPGR